MHSLRPTRAAASTAFAATNALASLALASLALALPAAAQESQPAPVQPPVARMPRPACCSVSPAAGPAVPARIVIEPGTVAAKVGDTLRLAARAYDAAGAELAEVPIAFFSASGDGLAVTPEGVVVARRGGEHRVVARTLARGASATAHTTIEVAYPALASIAVEGAGARLVAGSSTRIRARVLDASGAERPDIQVRWTTSNPMVASVNQFGVVSAAKPGPVVVRAAAQGLTGEFRFVVEANPVRALTLSVSADYARTGDVIHALGQAFDKDGLKVRNAPLVYTLAALPDDTASHRAAAAEIDQRGDFVAYAPGDYTVMVVAPGGVAAQRTIRVVAREAGQEVTLVGRAPMRGRATAGVRLWQGPASRDYALVCSSATTGDEEARADVFDVTDPASPRLADTLSLGGRLVGACAIDESGRTAAATIERAGGAGAIVVLDLTDPSDLRVLAVGEGLGNGAGPVVLHRRHALVVTDGRRVDVLDLEDPRAPRRVSSWEPAGPETMVRGVSAADGIAYASLGTDGVALIDLGGGKAQGSMARPATIATVRYPLAAAAAAMPYRSSAGRRYIVVADRVERPAEPTAPTPTVAAGAARVIDVTEPSRPREVARYALPDAGARTLVVDGDRLYGAFADGGMRVVDFGGELRGDLFAQGREMARFRPFDPQGLVPNAPLALEARPFRGNVFVADRHSGLWAVRLEPTRTPGTP